MVTKEEIEEHRLLCEEMKANWGSGPWQEEPHRVEFIHAGLQCLLCRNPRMGNWCGYVGVPPGHPAYGKPYDDVDVEAPGGLTYSSECNGYICHITKQADELYWLGFDCAHAFDLVPGMAATYKKVGVVKIGEETYGGNYRDVEWVTAATKRLAEQLARNPDTDEKDALLPA